jgi:hypothetical protein
MTMRIAAAGILMATLLAAAALIVAPALLDVSPRWVSSQPRIQATGIGECNKLAQLYRDNRDAVIPADCANRGAFKRLLPPPDDSPPPDDTPALAPGQQP